MTDVSDRATQQEELARDAALSHARNRAPLLLPVGECHNCEAVLDDPLLFCDSDCRDDWQLRNRTK